MKTEKTDKRYFVVYADYGGAWGWLRDDERTVRCNEFVDDVVDARSNVWLNTNIGKSLIDELYEWQSNFERNSLYNPNFDWEIFNKQGVKLTENLKQQIGHLFDDVVYEVPFEYQLFLKNGMATP